ncbi:hypothetical protein A1Q1_01750 [Trichosporon asahii var. asahii CBS 2479]|uniref:Uncharacterized protein n=1 Tax=Trichosporon asahii var. asahii (strain ATCC 90039 / CBS 2479 / JCM 2466 / KCTC 7840 / NBRC 103889/ NCYC 2677 / UAMH 7654) TaxID=1186058 RepID=J5T4E4_TRIAS|nr:hypothetical protein A1Q1_01750 [Trichosporon asahii var. asahii CBS 2479]EJT49101.1 hypothetical protein A1Q1_01750 [Trichosporon asahii var. asahii CBS 2479]
MSGELPTLLRYGELRGRQTSVQWTGSLAASEVYPDLHRSPRVRTLGSPLSAETMPNVAMPLCAAPAEIGCGRALRAVARAASAHYESVTDFDVPCSAELQDRG